MRRLYARVENKYTLQWFISKKNTEPRRVTRFLHGNGVKRDSLVLLVKQFYDVYKASPILTCYGEIVIR